MDRTGYIGGSDIAAIVGLNPHTSRINVYMAVLGIGDEEERINKQMKWGKKLEHVVLGELAESEQVFVLGRDRDGSVVVFCPDENIVPVESFKFDDSGAIISEAHIAVIEKDGVLIHPEFPHMRAHLDGLVYDYDGNLIGFADAKTTGAHRRREWGDSDTDHIPTEYHFQFAYYHELVRLWLGEPILCYVPVLIGGQDDRIYKVEYSEELVAETFEIIHEFWNDHILQEDPPAAEPTKAAAAALMRLYPEDTGEILSAMQGDELDIVAHELADANLEVREADAVKTAAQNRMKERLGEATRAEGHDWYLTWKRGQDKDVVDWEGITKELNDELNEIDGRADIYDSLIEKYTTVKPGTRRLYTGGLKKIEGATA